MTNIDGEPDTGYCPDDRPQDIGHRSAKIQFASPLKAYHPHEGLAKNSDSVGAIGHIARQPHDFCEDTQGNCRSITRQGIDDAGKKTAHNADND